MARTTSLRFLVTRTGASHEKENSPSLLGPHIPCSEVGHPLVEIGQSFVQNPRKLLLEEWDAFLDIYNERPDRTISCGVKFNHVYAIWLTCEQLQPTAVLESGVMADQSTYVLWAALPNAHMDPMKNPGCKQEKRWTDTFSNKTIYLTASNFMDITRLNYEQMIRDGMHVERTFSFVDDHHAPVQHIAALLRQGIHHL